MFLSMLKNRREMFNWENERERSLFLNDFEYLAENWEGQLPNLREIFRREEIDWLLTKCVDYYDDSPIEVAKPIDFVIRSGYKDEPDVDEGEKPSLRRTTPVHRAFYRRLTCTIHKLFQIYNRFDMNYADEVGFTHFHVACEWECEDAVEKFLELGQDPNCLVPKTGDSPLHLSLKHTNVKIFELLLINGADPNLANIEGSTPLHVIVQKTNGGDLARMLFELSEEKYQPLQIDAQDNWGRTPLHYALTSRCNKHVIEMLLRNGADPNSTNANELTLLHIICRNHLDSKLMETLFEACDNTQQTLHVDALDELGRTPLQWAVANFLPRMVNLLLDRGADVSKFIFPTESYFGQLWSLQWYDSLPNFELRLAICAVMIVERLENKGYELDQNGALTIVKFFAKLKMFEKSVDLQKCWYDDEDFASKARAIMIRDNDQSLSLYDLSRLRSAEAVKRLKYEDYYDFLCSFKLDELMERHKLACTLHLCEKLSRGFFRRWALELFLELTHYQLPILCCEKIIEKLMNQDLSNICLAATDQSLEKSVKTWVLGWFMCKTVPYIQGVSVAASVYSLVAVSLDRFLAIWWPLRCQITKSRARMMIIVIWFIALTTTSPWLLFFDLVSIYNDDPDVKLCMEIWPRPLDGTLFFIIGNLMLCYVLPMILISLCYVLIWIKVWRRDIPSDTKDDQMERLQQKSKVKVVKMLIIVVILFVLSWLPLYVIFARIKLGGKIAEWEEELLPIATPIAQWLGSSNSCINPILYAFFNKKYRRGFMAIIKSGQCCGKLRYYETVAIMSSSTSMRKSSYYVNNGSSRGRAFHGPPVHQDSNVSYIFNHKSAPA